MSEFVPVSARLSLDVKHSLLYPLIECLFLGFPSSKVFPCMRAASIELPEQLKVEVLDVALLAGVLPVLGLAADAHFLAHAVVLVHYVRSQQGRCFVLRTAFLG